MAGGVSGQQLGVPLGIYKERYRALDPVEAAMRTGAGFDGGAFRLRVLGHPLLAAWPEFALTPEASGRCPAVLYNGEAMILMIRYLIEGRRAPMRGTFLPYRELPWGAVYDRNFQGRCIQRLAAAFGSKPDAFSSACESLGGIRFDRGDVSYDLPFLENLIVRLTLWGGDEEFPPQSQWLFSDNTPDAFSAEDVAVIGDLIIGALKGITKR
jgi:hypothetical protein